MVEQAAEFKKRNQEFWRPFEPDRVIGSIGLIKVVWGVFSPVTRDTKWTSASAKKCI